MMRVLIIFALVAHLCHAGLIVDESAGDKHKPSLLEEHAEHQQQSGQYQQQQHLQQQHQQQQQQLHHQQSSHGNQLQHQQQHQQQQQQPQFQLPPQQYVILRSPTQNQGAPNPVIIHRDPQSALVGEHLHAPHVEVQDSQGPAHNVAVQYIPEHAQYNPQQVYVQHPQVGQQHILLQPVPQYVPQYVQSQQQHQPHQQQQQQQHVQQTQYVQQHKPIIGVPSMLRVGQAVQQQHPQISNQGEVPQQIPSYSQQSVPNVVNQQQVPQQAAHHIAARPEIPEVEQPQHYYPQTQVEHQNTYPHKDQQTQIVSHIIVPITAHHPSAVGVYTEAVGQGVPSQVQVGGQHYPQNAVQTSVSYPNAGQYVVNQQSHLLAYPVNQVHGVEIATQQSQEVEHTISQQVPQQQRSQKPTLDGQYVTQGPHVVIPHHSQDVLSSSSELYVPYVPLQSHQYSQSQAQAQPQQQSPHQPEHHQLSHHQPLQTISHSPSQSALSSSSSSPSSQQNGSHNNGATNNQGM